MAVTPSRAARTVAGREWPQVQFQYRRAPGVFGFSCAGHGGIVAVLAVAELPDVAVSAARELGKTEFIVFAPGETMYSGGSPAGVRTPVYRRESLEQWAAASPRLPSFEVWVAEEDCDWSCLVLADPGLLDGGIKAGYFSSHLTIDDVRGNAQEWNPAFLAALEPAGVT